MQTLDQAAEWAKCYADVAYFVHRYCWVFNANEEQWAKTHLATEALCTPLTTTGLSLC